jgi:hypothetical protein
MLWQYCLAWRDFALVATRSGTTPLRFRQSGSSHPGLKIELFLRQYVLYTATPAGKAMFQMMGVFAECRGGAPS